MISAPVDAADPGRVVRPLEGGEGSLVAGRTLLADRSFLVGRSLLADRSLLFDVGLGVTAMLAAIALNLFR